MGKDPFRASGAGALLTAGGSSGSRCNTPTVGGAMTITSSHHHHPSYSHAQQISAALFYGVSSLAIMFVNKAVLSIYSFPSFNFLAISQFTVTTVILYVLKKLGKVQITDVSWEVMRHMSPLIVISLCNVLSGLSGTKKINLPMFTVLRRFSILMTMLLEKYLLGVHPSQKVQLSVFLMIFGTIVAALSDLAFDLEGYMMILLNDVFTALNGVVMKKTVSSSCTINKMGVLFHNSWVSIFIMLGILSLRPEEVQRVIDFPFWNDYKFLFSFLLASIMGSILNYSTFLCTAVNSALTTTVVGCIKNILTTYLGMIFLPDYVFSLSNFVGLNISIAGSVIYSVAEFKDKVPKAVGAQKRSGSLSMLENGKPATTSSSAADTSTGRRKNTSGDNVMTEERQRLLNDETVPSSSSTKAAFG